MKIILLILALLFAGCENDVTGVRETDRDKTNTTSCLLDVEVRYKTTINEQIWHGDALEVSQDAEYIYINTGRNIIPLLRIDVLSFKIKGK